MRGYTFFLRLVVLVLLCNSCLFSQIRLGLDISGDYKMSADGDSETYDMDNGLVIGYDYLLQNQDKMQLGVGAEFMFNKGAENESQGKVAFHSLYGYGKYALDEKIYGYGRIGYNFHTGDDDYQDLGALIFGEGINTTLEGGLSYAFGGGFTLTPTIKLEFLLASHNGNAIVSYENLEETIKVTYKRTSIGIIYTL